jgi:hypothetical protein
MALDIVYSLQQLEDTSGSLSEKRDINKNIDSITAARRKIHKPANHFTLGIGMPVNCISSLRVAFSQISSYTPKEKTAYKDVSTRERFFILCLGYTNTLKQYHTLLLIR